MAPSKKTAGTAEPSTAPGYWADACRHLVKKDRVMKRLIANRRRGPRGPRRCVHHAGAQHRGPAGLGRVRAEGLGQVRRAAPQHDAGRRAQAQGGRHARRRPVRPEGGLPGGPGAAFRHRPPARQGLGCNGRRGHRCRTGRHPRHRPMDGRHVPDIPPGAAQRAAPGRRHPAAGHQPALFLGRPGQPQRCPRSRRGLETLVQRGELVYLAVARPLPVDY